MIICWHNSIWGILGSLKYITKIIVLKMCQLEKFQIIQNYIKTLKLYPHIIFLLDIDGQYHIYT